MLGRIADITWGRPKLVLAVIGVLAVLAGAYAYDVEHHLTPAGFTDPASESERATELLREQLGYDANPGLVVVVRPKGGGKLDVTDPAVRREVARLAGALRDTKYVGAVVNPLADGRAAAGLIARDGESLVIAGHLSAQDIESDGGDAAVDAKKRVTSDSLDVMMGGYAPSFKEVEEQTRNDLTNAEIIAFPALTVLLLLVFRGVVAAAIPLLIGVLSILGTFVLLRLMSEFVDTSLFALNISTGLSLGLAVDYALLLVSRYREELERDGPTREAHRKTVLSAGHTVLFSGFTVAAAMAALILMPQRFLYSVGVAGAAVGALSALTAVFVVPSLLAIAGTRINALSIRRGPSVSDESGRWYGLARTVMRRPVIFAVASSALLLALASPLFGTTLTGPSAEVVPPGKPSFAANAYIDSHYPRDVSEAVTVTVTGADRGELAGLRDRMLHVEGVERASPFRAAGDVAYANLALSGPALYGPQQDSVRDVRALAPPGGAELLVSGNTARFIDQKQSLKENAPVVIGVIAVGTLLLLFLLTGSVVLPLKALLMNALTLGATLGILVLGFQHGLLEAPTDYTGPSAIEVTSLVFLFAVTFALATDYAVLVMARIKEYRDAGESNEEAVARGIGRTGRIISAAAVMIGVVFLAFAVSPVFFMKQMAIGISIGVLLDATIVRGLLVPSLMRLLGERNWWAPAPLRRLHERFGLKG